MVIKHIHSIHGGILHQYIVNSIIPNGIFRYPYCYFTFLLYYLPPHFLKSLPFPISHIRSFVSFSFPLSCPYLPKEFLFSHFPDEITVPFCSPSPHLGNGCVLLSWFLQLLLRLFSAYCLLPVSWHFILSVLLLIVVIELDCKMCS